jgi:hypothetical protein
MKNLAIILVILVFFSNGLLLADQLPKPTTNIESNIENQIFTMKKEPGYRSDLLFDQPPPGYDPWNIGSAQWDSIISLDSRIADNFTVPYQANIDSLVWWGGLWNLNGNHILDFWIEIYPDSTGNNQPKQDPIYCERVPFDEVLIDTYPAFVYNRYSAVIPPFLADSGETYWISFMATLIFPPQSGTQIDTFPGMGDSQQGFFKSDYFGCTEWTSTTDFWGSPFEIPFQVYGNPYSIEEDNTTVPNTGDILFNSITNSKIRFNIKLTSPMHVKAQIFDLTGRMVGTIIDSELPSGENVCEHDSKLPAGVYFVNVKAGEVTKMGKTLVVR